MIEAFGGDVVKYVGDAVIAAWCETDPSWFCLPHVARP